MNTHDMQVILLYIFSVIAVILGFLALLKQKTYIDSKTNKPTNVQIPFFGKIQTNYPALIFVFLGFGLAFYVFQESKGKEKVTWNIRGSFKSPDNNPVDWCDGELKIIVPAGFESGMKSNGTFTLSINLDEGQEFEDVVDAIIYTNKVGQGQLLPKEDSSLIGARNNHFISYKAAKFDIVNN